MLSFDITDRQLKIVKGFHSGGKIKITKSATLDIEEDLITNGEISDIPALATQLSDFLKAQDMWDKEAVVSISSNQIVFKELQIPKAKGGQFLTMVQNQMQHTMGISDKYSIAYTIVGESDDEKSNSLKVLATACPFGLVDGHRTLFSLLGIALRAVNVSCNCVTRIVLSDNKSKDNMPLLVVQVDEHFLSLNLYENNQLAFSRYVLIDEEDYGTEDYVNEALNENIFRMIQFNKSRGGTGIRNVYLYGDVKDYIRITNNLEQFDIKTNILTVPNQITGFENFEFTHFVNAIGALFKRKKETERINLLEVDSTTGRDGGINAFLATVLAVFVASVTLLVAVFFVFDLSNKDVIKETDKVNEYINSKSTQDNLTLVNTVTRVLGKLTTYTDSVENANFALMMLPRADAEMFSVIQGAAKDKAKIDTFAYTDGRITLTLSSKKQSEPADVVEALLKTGYFASVKYNGFTGEDTITYSLTLVKKAGAV